MMALCGTFSFDAYLFKRRKESGEKKSSEKKVKKRKLLSKEINDVFRLEQQQTEREMLLWKVKLCPLLAICPNINLKNRIPADLIMHDILKFQPKYKCIWVKFDWMDEERTTKSENKRNANNNNGDVRNRPNTKWPSSLNVCEWNFASTGFHCPI